MNAAAAFAQAAQTLGARFGNQPPLTGFPQPNEARRFYSVRPKVAIMLQHVSAKCVLLSVAYERRPGVWFHLGDMFGTPEYEGVMRELGIPSSSARTDLGGDVAAFAESLAAYPQRAAA